MTDGAEGDAPARLRVGSTIVHRRVLVIIRVHSLLHLQSTSSVDAIGPMRLLVVGVHLLRAVTSGGVRADFSAPLWVSFEPWRKGSIIFNMIRGSTLPGTVWARRRRVHFLFGDTSDTS